MNRIAGLSAADRRALLAEGTQQLKLLPVVLEKDFWVCWTLGLLFSHPEWKEALVFKGGTALSKVFGAIRRFSEDIDLSVAPAILGISESELNEAGSRRRRDHWMERLEATCAKWVSECLQPELESKICRVLGCGPTGQSWLRFEADNTSQSPVLLFYYPTVLDPGAPYMRRWVKLEFGSLTDQRPVGKHRVSPWLATALPAAVKNMGCEVVALELERAFWEKATILHAEYHRDWACPMPPHYSRHYADVAALANRPETERAITDAALRARVVSWKSRFFARSWARYDLAAPGTFRLVPPQGRWADLARDYSEMQDMFLDPPPSLDHLMAILRALEDRINRSSGEANPKGYDHG